MARTNRQAKVEGGMLRALTRASKLLNVPVTSQDRWAFLEVLRNAQRRARRKAG